MPKKRLQIDVKGSIPQDPNVVECKLYIDGYGYTFYTSNQNYQQLIKEGFFVRDGKQKDSAGTVNTTNVFFEGK
jgi:hypothetical protein